MKKAWNLPLLISLVFLNSIQLSANDKQCSVASVEQVLESPFLDAKQIGRDLYIRNQDLDHLRTSIGSSEKFSAKAPTVIRINEDFVATIRTFKASQDQQIVLWKRESNSKFKRMAKIGSANSISSHLKAKVLKTTEDILGAEHIHNDLARISNPRVLIANISAGILNLPISVYQFSKDKILRLLQGNKFRNFKTYNNLKVFPYLNGLLVSSRELKQQTLEYYEVSPQGDLKLISSMAVKATGHGNNQSVITGDGKVYIFSAAFDKEKLQLNQVRVHNGMIHLDHVGVFPQNTTSSILRPFKNDSFLRFKYSGEDISLYEPSSKTGVLSPDSNGQVYHYKHKMSRLASLYKERLNIGMTASVQNHLYSQLGKRAQFLPFSNQSKDELIHYMEGSLIVSLKKNPETSKLEIFDVHDLVKANGVKDFNLGPILKSVSTTKDIRFVRSGEHTLIVTQAEGATQSHLFTVHTDASGIRNLDYWGFISKYGIGEIKFIETEEGGEFIIHDSVGNKHVVNP